MPDKDLRRQALAPSKTLSRRAKERLSRQSSAANSTANSPTGSTSNSRTHSRQPSDDEDSRSESAFSNGSANDFLDDYFAQGSGLDAGDGAIEEEEVKHLTDLIEELTNRKRSTAEGRELCYARFTNSLQAGVHKSEVELKFNEIYSSLLKSTRDGEEKEAMFALKALTMAIATCPDDAFQVVEKPLKDLVADSESCLVKAAAIRALSIAAFLGGLADEGTIEVMEFFLEISESDGEAVGAVDDGKVVAAALQEWGFLASSLDDLSDISRTAMDTLVDQLDSGDVNVQIAAGETIALLYECSWSELEEGERFSPDDHMRGHDDAEDDKSTHGPSIKTKKEKDAAKSKRHPSPPPQLKKSPMINRYQVYGREEQLKDTLNAIANTSGRGISKQDKKALHENFTDFVNAIEYPYRGPRYSNALHKETMRPYGSRLKIKSLGDYMVNKWWKLVRLNGLRRALGNGWVIHYYSNDAVNGCLHTQYADVDDEDE